jgi:hypothetical protein
MGVFLKKVLVEKEIDINMHVPQKNNKYSIIFYLKTRVCRTCTLLVYI